MEINRERVLGGINSGSNLYTTSGAVEQPTIIYDEIGGTITVGEGLYRTFLTADFSEVLVQYSIPETILEADPDTKYYVCVTYNNGDPLIYLETDKENTNDSNVLVIFTVFTEVDDMDPLNWGTEGRGLANKINERLIDTNRFARSWGFDLASSNSEIICSTGEAYVGTNRTPFLEVSSVIDECELLVKTALGEWTKSNVTVFPNTKYDSGGSGLVDLTDNEYGVVWVWRTMGNMKEIYIAMGGDSYLTADSAKLDKIPSDLPERITLGSLLIGRIIFLKGATTVTVESAFDTVFTPSAATQHNALLGVQGGQVNQYYHLTSAQHTTLGNTTGINTGDETQSTILTKIGYTPEDVSNKATVLTTSNDTLYPTVKAVVTALAGKEPTVTKGTATAGSNKITIGGTPTNAVIGSGFTVDVNEANLTHNNISSKQGGTTGEYYHLTNTQYSALVSMDYTSTAPVTISNSSVEATMIGTGVGSLTIPANRLIAGTKIKIKARGYVSTDKNQTTTIRAKLGAVTVFTSSASLLPNDLVNNYFELEFDMVVRTTGVSGTIIGEGRTLVAPLSGVGTPNMRQMVMTATATVNTTISNTLDLTYQWTNALAANSLTTQMVEVELCR